MDSVSTANERFSVLLQYSCTHCVHYLSVYVCAMEDDQTFVHEGSGDLSIAVQLLDQYVNNVFSISAPAVDLKENEKQSTEDQLKDILYPTEKSQLAHSIELTRSMNLTNSTDTPAADVTQSLFLPDLNGLSEGKRGQ